MKKSCKRILSLVLALAMVFALCAPALADKSYEPYKYYMCVGDSIAAGCALTKDGSETYFDQETDDYTTVYSPDYIYYGYDFSAVPNAYHSIVAEALDAELLQYARSGLRAVELRYFLTGEYNDYDTDYTWGNTYFDTDGNGFSLDDLDAINQQVDYASAIKKADVISINVGSNDVLSYTLTQVLNEMTSDSDNELLSGIKKLLNNGGSISKAFVKLLEVSEKLGLLPQVVATMNSTFEKTYAQFVENYDIVIEKIYELNPDITVVGVGVFNPFQNFSLSEDSSLDLQGILAPIVSRINNYIENFETTESNFYYADVVGTETYQMNYDDKYFSEYLVLKVHPTKAGHQYMAEQILNALPERGTLPFSDVSTDDWYYDDVYYAWYHGLMEGGGTDEFEPDRESTRAEAVQVLYRMAGEPDVTGLSEPFADVPNNFWAHDAIVWAYNNGIVYGFSDIAFRPYSTVTREQLVAILYRFAGSPESSSDIDTLFTDSDDVYSGFRTAVYWAVSEGIINGLPDGSFSPKGTVDRAQLAVILARYDRNIL